MDAENITNNSCGKCGKCCQTIWLRHDKKSIQEILNRNPDNYDAKFILENWDEISMEKVQKINPWYIKSIKYAFKKISMNFYTCKKYNSEKGICNDYENRPDVCKNYPFYKNSKVINGVNKLHPTFSLYSDKCIFQKVKATDKEWNQEYKIIAENFIKN